MLVAGLGLGAVRDGVWAEAVNAPRGAVVPLPEGVVPREAAAMGVAGLTALNVVRNLARVTAEDRVLVHGHEIRIGDAIFKFVESGAERVVVGGPDKLAEQISPLEPTVAFDPLGGDYVAPVVQSLAHRGRMVSFGTSAGAEVTFDMQQLYRKMLSLLGYGGGQLRPEERRSGLEDALAALRDGAIRVRVDEVLALERVNEAFACAVGKSPARASAISASAWR